MTALARYRVFWTGLVGGPGVSTFHLDPDLQAPTIATSQDLADEVMQVFTGMAAITSSAILWTGDSVVDYLDPATGQVTSQDGVTPDIVVGTDAAQRLSPLIQGLMEWSTGVFIGGRQLRGKTFWAGATEAVNDPPGVPSAGYISGAAAQGGYLLSSIGHGVIYSRKNAQYEPITSVSVWGQWAYLSGRRD